MTFALEHIKSQLPQDTMISAIGISLGAHLLLRYCGEQKDKCFLRSAGIYIYKYYYFK